MANVQVGRRKDRIVQVDDDIVDIISCFNVSVQKKLNGKEYVLVTMSMHRLAMLLSGHTVESMRDLDVDHIDGDGLNNMTSNLRMATKSQNCANSKPRGGKSKYKGVTKSGHRWAASISIKGKRTHLGTFATEEEAAYVYDMAAIEQFEEFAYTNNIPIPKCNVVYRNRKGIRIEKRKNTSSKYRGVWWDAARNKWQAMITNQGSKRHLGRFDTEDEAAAAYNIAAKELHGNLSVLNDV